MIKDLLFPKHCLNCGREGLYVCQKCQTFLAEAEPLYFEDKQGLDSLISIWQYEGLVKEAIRQIRAGARDIVKELMREVEVDAFITYVPMSSKKEKKRGFNLAKIIAETLKKDKVIPLLKKIKDNEGQESLEYEDRLDNVKGCFTAQDTDIKKIVLVDDFYVTGTTMQECSYALKEKGVKEVHGFVLARA